MDKNIEKRNSSIDLLRVIGMFFIILSHSLATGINVSNTVNSFSDLIMIIYAHMGHIGNCLFIICSAYLLVDSDKLNFKKILYMVLDTFIISISVLFIYCLRGYKFTAEVFFKFIFPITYNNNWFIGCYILYYFIHPFLNKIIRQLNQKQLLRVVMFIIGYFYIWQFIKKSTYANILGFIALYFVIAYIKKYMQNYQKRFSLNVCILIISIIGFVYSLVILNILIIKFKICDNNMMYMSNIINPFIIMIAISIFNLLINKKFYNKFVSYVGSISLIIYIIHENTLIATLTRPLYFKYIYINYGYDHINLICILTAIAVFIISVIIASIYVSTIQKLTKKCGNVLYKYIKIVFNKLETTLLKLN